MFRVKNLYVSLTMIVAVGFLINIMATDMLAQKDSKKVRLRISLRLVKQDERNPGKNRYKVILVNGKALGEAFGVEDPETEDPLEGRFKIEYRCTVDDLPSGPTLKADVQLIGGKSNRFEYYCDPDPITAGFPNVPLILTSP